METIVQSTAFQDYADKVITYHQYKDFHELSTSEAKTHSDTLEAFGDLYETVADNPELVSAYVGVLRTRSRQRPDAIAKVRAIETDILNGLSDLELVSDTQYDRERKELAETAGIKKRAEQFVRIFRKTIPRDQLPKRPVKRKQNKAPEVAEEATDTTTPAVVLEVTSTPEELPTNAREELGKEYDDLVKAYQKHPLNRETRRHKRDFEGFKGHLPKPLEAIDNNDRNDRDGRNWFVAHMNRFPLLDGLEHEVVLRKKIEAGLEAFEELKTENVAGKERQALEQVAIIGAGAFETMYECNLRWVMKIANRFPESPAYRRMDMVQDGCKGLRRAIQKYNPAFGFKFSTYSEKWIRQAIQRGMPVTGYDLFLPAHAVQSGKNV
jgi:DNA-directed RNA polymerase sigma subunit (sigma70/sigma32)